MKCFFYVFYNEETTNIFNIDLIVVLNVLIVHTKIEPLFVLSKNNFFFWLFTLTKLLVLSYVSPINCIFQSKKLSEVNSQTLSHWIRCIVSIWFRFLTKVLKTRGTPQWLCLHFFSNRCIVSIWFRFLTNLLKTRGTVPFTVKWVKNLKQWTFFKLNQFYWFMDTNYTLNLQWTSYEILNWKLTNKM